MYTAAHVGYIVSGSQSPEPPGRLLNPREVVVYSLGPSET